MEPKHKVPAAKQRYWVWARRANGTYRTGQVLGPDHDKMTLLDLATSKDLVCRGEGEGGRVSAGQVLGPVGLERGIVRVAVWPCSLSLP